MRLTVRHTYHFGADRARVGPDLVRPEAWDALRERPGPFELPRTRAEWEAKAQTPELLARARDVASVAASLGAARMSSYGVGNAGLELNLVRAAPQLELACTEFAPRTVVRLTQLFREAKVVQHDLRRDEPLPAELHLMHRIDTELSDSDWKRVLSRFHDPVLFVPVLLLDWSSLARELARRVRRPRSARAGYLRSRDALRELWAPTHEDEPVAVGDLDAFLLRRR